MLRALTATERPGLKRLAADLRAEQEAYRGLAGHERFNAEPGNQWLRRTMAQLFSGSEPPPQATSAAAGRSSAPRG